MVSKRKRSEVVIKSIADAIAQVQQVSIERDQTLKEWAAKLRQDRQREHVSLRQIAKKLGFSAAYVSDVELGRRSLSAEFAMDYMDALSLLKRR